VMLTPAVHSFVELTLSPVFRRLWCSSYEAIEDGNPDREGLMGLYAAQIPPIPRPSLAGDHTAWPRLSAPTLWDRTIEHHPTKVKGNKPITIGQGYNTLAWLPPDDAKGSWALPCVHERIRSAETPIDTGVSQLRRATAVLPTRPISLWNSEYGNATFVKGSADIPTDKVIRLRPNICLWGPRHPTPGGVGGRYTEPSSSSKTPPPGEGQPRSWR